MVNLEVLNPVAEIAAEERVDLEPRLSDLSCKTIGLFWNAKVNGNIVNQYTAELLAKKFKDVSFKNYEGTLGSIVRRASPEDISRMVNECDAIVGSVGD